MSSSMVKGSVLLKCRVQKNLENSYVAKTIAKNLLISSNTGRGITVYDLSLTDETLYVEALRQDIIGGLDVAYTDIIPRQDIRKFEVKHDGIHELITLVAVIKGKEETLSCYRENTKEDYIATIMQGLLEPNHMEE